CCETPQKCHCERPKGARQSYSPTTKQDCFVASLLAKTQKWYFATVPKGCRTQIALSAWGGVKINYKLGFIFSEKRKGLFPLSRVIFID
ncbi:MAG: hypothetical protein V1739_08730, partial [Candidatus Omnitrophota bacterium]